MVVVLKTVLLKLRFDLGKVVSVPQRFSVLQNTPILSNLTLQCSDSAGYARRIPIHNKLDLQRR